jgi:hypothetical protein
MEDLTPSATLSHITSVEHIPPQKALESQKYSFLIVIPTQGVPLLTDKTDPGRQEMADLEVEISTY